MFRVIVGTMSTLKPHQTGPAAVTPIKFASFLFKPKPVPFPHPDPTTTRLLKVAADAKNLKFGRTVHARLVVYRQTSLGTESDMTSANSLINLYAKCDQVLSARQLFDLMPKRNVVSWSALMAGYLHTGLALEVLRLFRNMVSLENICPNEYILATVLSSCANSGRVEEGKQCHSYVFKSGLVFHQYVKNALIHMYSSCLDMDGAISVLDMVSGYNIVSYNSLVNGLLEHGHLKGALEVLNMMVSQSVVWDSITYVTVFRLLTHLKYLGLGHQVHSLMITAGVPYDVFVGTAIIDMYGKCGNIMNAKRTFDHLQNRNVVSWTAIMDAHVQNGYFEEALSLHPKMGIENITPNEGTFVVLLNSSACLSALRHGDLLHAFAQKSGFRNYINVGNALINMYTKCGDIEAANEVFSEMTRRDFVTWNSMISGYSHHGLGKEALDVFDQMLAVGESPNYVTFIGVLVACARMGLVTQGFYYLNHLMKQIGIEPGVEHHTCFVGLLSRAGMLDEAKNYLSSVPVKWDIVAWRTLLSACHVHQNHDLGKQIADIIVQMDPNDVGTYTLLSNMHAKARRWDGVVKIRKLMKERNIKKEPGVSWVEIKNITHVFVAEDSSHPDSRQIRQKVKELLVKITPLGYVPDVAVVMHDVEDEQKESYLSYHSEKLAVAYCLMKTPTEAPIRIIKNLRMCDDCHTAMKLISKVTNRVIIVRDANRFHYFKDGCCSCADYW